MSEIEQRETGEIYPHSSGTEAEAIIESLTRNSSLDPFVFRSPKYVTDKREFSDIAILFKNTLILIEIKGNKFNCKNPQRYLNHINKGHQQLTHAKNIAKKHSKEVFFKNKYFSIKTSFEDIKKIYLISISAGKGEMEVASDSKDIDYAKLDFYTTAKCLGFFDTKTNIHSFLLEEWEFACIHLDTIKDLCWYLDFEEKFFKNDFEKKDKKQEILPIIDTHRQDLIITYVKNYYRDEELHKTGNVDLNRILGQDNDIKDVDFVLYIATDARKTIEENSWKEILREKEISYMWDNIIRFILENHDEKRSLSKEILETMENISRYERYLFSRAIQETEEVKKDMRNMFSLTDGNKTLISYGRVEYKNPDDNPQEEGVNKHLYSVSCRVKFSEKFEGYRDKIEKVLLITRHIQGKYSSFTIGFFDVSNVDNEMCKKIDVL